MTRHRLAALLIVAGCGAPAELGDAAGDDAQDAAMELDGARPESTALQSAAESPTPPTQPDAAGDGAIEPPRASAVDPAPEPEHESISTLATLPQGEHPARMSRARLTSRALRSARSLDGSLRRARRAAPRERRATYRAVPFRLRSPDLETQLLAAAETYLRPHPMDFVYYADVAPVAHPTNAAFEIGEGSEPVEAAAVDELLVHLASLLASHPHLRLFTLDAGWADAVGGSFSGVAIVDPTTGEALWVFAEATWSS